MNAHGESDVGEQLKGFPNPYAIIKHGTWHGLGGTLRCPSSNAQGAHPTLLMPE